MGLDLLSSVAEYTTLDMALTDTQDHIGIHTLTVTMVMCYYGDVLLWWCLSHDNYGVLFIQITVDMIWMLLSETDQYIKIKMNVATSIIDS